MTVAIVGVGCRLPGANGPDAFFDLLMSRKSAAAPLPLLRWDPAVLAAELPAGAHPLARGHLVDDLPLDWRALRLPPLDAERMHLLERAALGALLQAIVDARLFWPPGQTAPPGAEGDLLNPVEQERRRSRTRTFIAATTFGPDPHTDQNRRVRRFELQGAVSAALREELRDRHAEIDDIIEGLFNIAAPPILPESLQATASLLAGRVANLFDFSGGHVAVDGGLCSGLAALEQAVMALEDGACDVALVCGVSPILSPSVLLSFAHRGFLAHGHHQPFDPKSTGTLLGEGAVAFALVRSDDARSPYARLRSVQTVATTGDDGAAVDVGRAVLAAGTRALERAPGLRVQLVETRIAGVKDHDDAVLAALAEVFGRDQPAVTSSVGNVGLLPSTGGLVSVLRAALSLKRGMAPGQTDPVSGGALSCADSDVPLGADSGVAVCDAGLGALAGVALLTSARAPRASRVSSGRRPGEDLTQAPSSDRAVAVVGAGITAPGANDVRGLWRSVLERHDRIGDLPASRFDVDRFVRSSDVGSLLRTRLAATVDLPPEVLEARDEDPATWLARKVAREGMLDAGGLQDVRPERVGVYFGQLPFRFSEAALEKRVLFAGHLELTRQALAEADVAPETVDRICARARQHFDDDSHRIGHGTFEAASGFTTARAVAREIGARGPVVALDAACASALVCVEAGMAALRRGDVDIALCGGVAFNLLPEYYLALSVLGVLSPRAAPPFSVQADGFVPGEGAGCVVLVRRADAQLKLGQLGPSRRARAIIRGVGFSSDGRGPSVFAPRAEGQISALRRALADAGVDGGTVDLIEAHGTGTPTGDECELKSYAAVYGDRDPLFPATLGTIKSQLGHLSSAAGAVGLVKTVLALEERILPPSLFDQTRHSLALSERVPLDLATVARPWITRPGRPRRACVSSFGIGGVNLHVVLEEASAGCEPVGTSPGPARGPHADRFEVTLAPVSLPARAKLFSLAGRRVLLVPDVGTDASPALAPAFRQELAARGATVLDPADATDRGTAAIEAETANLVSDGGVDVVVDLSTADPAPHAFAAPAELATWAETRLCAALARLRGLYGDFIDAPPRSRAYVVVTRMGDLGLLGSTPERAGGAVLLGLMKGVKLELPAVLAKGVDFDPLLDPASVARLALDDLEDGNDRLESLHTGGRRLVMNLRRAPWLPDEPALRAFRPGDVFLFSGGGRGIVFECALGLALVGGCAIVCGRTELPADPTDAPWHLDDDAFAEHRKSELLRRRAADRTLTPARFAQEFELVERQRELVKNLARARKAGADLRYEACDINDPRAVERLVAKVRAEHGRIDGVVHGAMVEWSTSLLKKTDAIAQKTLRTKLLGFLHLLRATAEAPPHTFLSFSSGAGRFGNKGQSDYCAANNLLASVTAAAARSMGHATRFATLDWTAWADAGAAVRNAELVKNLGLTSIRAQEGVGWFLRELTHGQGGECIVFEERLLETLQLIGEQAEGTGDRCVRVDDAGELLQPGAWPLVDRLIETRGLAARAGERGAGQVFVLERTFDVDADEFVQGHRLFGVPILPAAFGVELVAESAALVCPGFQVSEVRDFDVGVPTKLHRGEPVTLRMHATIVDRTAERVVVDVETRSDLVRNQTVLQRDRLHHRARVVLRPQSATPELELHAVPELSGIEHARSFFHLAEDPIGLGPLYSRGEWVRLGSQEVTGVARPPRQRDILRRTSAPRFCVDPLLLDTGWQIAANWDGLSTQNFSVPLRFDVVRLCRPRLPHEAARVHARVVSVVEDLVRYDVFLVGERDELLLETRGLILRRVGKGSAP